VSIGRRRSQEINVEAEAIVTETTPQARTRTQEGPRCQKALSHIDVRRYIPTVRHQLASKLLLAHWNVSHQFHDQGKAAMIPGYPIIEEKCLAKFHHFNEPVATLHLQGRPPKETPHLPKDLR